MSLSMQSLTEDKFREHRLIHTTVHTYTKQQSSTDTCATGHCVLRLKGRYENYAVVPHKPGVVMLAVRAHESQIWLAEK